MCGREMGEMTAVRDYRTSGRLAPQINQPYWSPPYVNNGVTFQGTIRNG